MAEKKLVFENGTEIEFSPGDRPEKIRGHNPPIVWEAPWTEEQVEGMHAYFLHAYFLHNEKVLPFEMHCTPKGQSWYYEWWQRKTTSVMGDPCE